MTVSLSKRNKHVTQGYSHSRIGRLYNLDVWMEVLETLPQVNARAEATD